MCMEVVQSIGAPMDAGFRELRLQEAEKRSWYREGMHAQVSQWRKAVDIDGDYVEK